MLEELIVALFRSGLRNDEIVMVLQCEGSIEVSLKQVGRILRRHGLYRRKYYSPLGDVRSFIEQQVEQSGHRLGYRLMHLRCVKAGFVVQKEVVRVLMRAVDARGVSMRQRRRLRHRHYLSRGPNFLWHLDGYDKLKPYGLCIHGCIDGYSRYVLWLKVGYTNNDPRIVSQYFMGTVQELGGIPATIRGDMGTENSHIAQMQTFMGGQFLYGTSQHNQRIEAWWSMLRRSNAEFWMNIFRQLKEDGQFCGDMLDKNLIQFCFTSVLQADLNTFVDLWNSHNIRKQNVNVSGRPFMLYWVPSHTGHNVENYLRRVDNLHVHICVSECATAALPCEAEDVFNLACIYMEENGLSWPSTAYDAANLYTVLRDLFYRDM